MGNNKPKAVISSDNAIRIIQPSNQGCVSTVTFFLQRLLGYGLWFIMGVIVGFILGD
jgi:hypothetical protein